MTATFDGLKRQQQSGIVAAGWDESKHPRQPGGTEKGGEFASIGFQPDQAAVRAYLAAHPMRDDPVFNPITAAERRIREFNEYDKLGFSEERINELARMQVAGAVATGQLEDWLEHAIGPVVGRGESETGGGYPDHFQRPDGTIVKLEVSIQPEGWSDKYVMVLSDISATPRGTGAGSETMRILKSYADGHHLPLVVHQADNPEFYERLPWLRETYSNYSGSIKHFRYDPDSGEAAATAAATPVDWDESQHPRHPKGSEQGGQFASKNGEFNPDDYDPGPGYPTETLLARIRADDQNYDDVLAALGQRRYAQERLPLDQEVARSLWYDPPGLGSELRAQLREGALPAGIPVDPASAGWSSLLNQRENEAVQRGESSIRTWGDVYRELDAEARPLTAPVTVLRGTVERELPQVGTELTYDVPTSVTTDTETADAFSLRMPPPAAMGALGSNPAAQEAAEAELEELGPRGLLDPGEKAVRWRIALPAGTRLTRGGDDLREFILAPGYRVRVTGVQKPTREDEVDAVVDAVVEPAGTTPDSRNRVRDDHPEWGEALVTPRHRSDIRDAEAMLEAPLAASALNLESEALTQATARLQRQYEKVYRRAAKRAAAAYRRLAKVVTAAAWDESKHPREPVGTKEGGRFTEQVTGGIPDDQRAYIAEGALERGGMAGRKWNVQLTNRSDENWAQTAHAQAEREATDWARQISGVPELRVQFANWVGGGPRAAKGEYDSFQKRIAVLPDATDLTILHEVAHAMSGTQEGPGGHGAAFREAAARLYSEQLSPEAGELFAELATPPLTAAASPDPNEVLSRETLLESFGSLTGVVTAAAWDESKHPREPEGTKEGGQFRSLYHGTTAVKAEVIREEGFKPELGFGNLFGEGVYLTLDRETADWWAKEKSWGGLAESAVLEVTGNITNPFVYDKPLKGAPGGWPTMIADAAGANYREEYAKLEKQWKADWREARKTHPSPKRPAAGALQQETWAYQKAKREVEDARWAEVQGKGWRWRGFSENVLPRILEDRGYDALVLTNQEAPAMDNAGGNQVLIFDPKKALPAALSAAATPDPNEVLSRETLMESFGSLTGLARRELLRQASAALATAPTDAGDDSGGGDPQEQVLELLLELLQEQAGVQAERLVAGAQDAVQSVILTSMKEGWTVPQTAKALEEKLVSVAPWQATMLARTDLIALGNGASLQRAVVLDDPNLQYKTWLATPDERTRINHRHAHGQTVPIRQPFTVGGEQLLYPGDPSASDGNVINCRCTILYSDSPLGPAGVRQIAMLPDLAVSAAGFVEAQHPRHPKGVREGGRFRDNAGPAMLSREELGEEEWQQALEGLRNDLAVGPLRAAYKRDPESEAYHYARVSLRGLGGAQDFVVAAYDDDGGLIGTGALRWTGPGLLNFDTAGAVNGGGFRVFRAGLDVAAENGAALSWGAGNDRSFDLYEKLGFQPREDEFGDLRFYASADEVQELRKDGFAFARRKRSLAAAGEPDWPEEWWIGSPRELAVTAAGEGRRWRGATSGHSFDPAKHPRHPAGSPGSVGGEFSPKENAATGAEVDWTEARREFEKWAENMRPYYTPGEFARLREAVWADYHNAVNTQLPALQARLNAAQVPGLTIQPQLNPQMGGDLDVVSDPQKVADYGPDFEVELPAAEGGLPPSFTVWTFPEGANARHADDPDWHPVPEGTQVEEVLDITDTDFFPDGPDSDLAGDYARAVDAARGVPDEPGFATVYRGMSDAEYDAWQNGEEIPLGKFFAGVPTAQYAQDIAGAPPNLYTFRVPRAMLMQTGEHEYQLKKRGKLGRPGEIVQASAWDESKHPRHPKGSERGGQFALYHGTNVPLKPGDVVTTAKELGYNRPGELPAHYDPAVVYMSTGDHLAERYAVAKAGKEGGEPHVYEVEPVGEVLADPEAESGFGTDQRIAPAARVVREVKLPGLVHWDDGMMKRGPGAAKKLYHVAPVSQRENIANEGLQDKLTGKGVFLWETPEDAAIYQKIVGGDVYEVDPEGLEVAPDPWWSGDSERRARWGGPGRSVVTSGVPKKNVQMAPKPMSAAAVNYQGGGGMVCLYPKPDEAEAIARVNGQSPEDLHVTLLYFEDGVPDEAEDVIRELGFQGMEGQISGIARFQPGEDGVPVVGVVSAVGLNELRAALAERLPGYSERHGFVPHLTLGYDQEEDPLVEDPEGAVGLPVTFSAVSVKNGEEARQDITAAGWDESKHPREPGGKPEGGQFAHANSGFSRQNADDTEAAMQEIWGHTSASDADMDEREMAKIEVMNTIAQKLAGDEDLLSLLPALAYDATGNSTSDELVAQYEGQFVQADSPEKLTAALGISNWAGTSGDHDPIALQFQIAAEQEFGIKAHPFVHEAWAEEQALAGGTHSEQLKEMWRDKYVFDEQQQAGARKFLRAQYEATQEMLKASGLKEVTLYRGMRWSATDVPGEIKELVGPPSLERIAEPQYAQKMMKISQNPLSSWSWDYTTAALFSHGTTYGAVLGTRVPVERILSTPYTGFGALHEGEFVVLGEEGMEAYAEVRRQSGTSSMRDGFLAEWEKAPHARR